MTRQEQIEAAAKEHSATTDGQVDFRMGAEWADINPCLHSWEPDTAMTMMRCEWCGIEADRTSEKNKLKAQLAIAVDVLEDLSLACVDIVGQDGFVKTTEAQRAFEALAKIEEMK